MTADRPDPGRTPSPGPDHLTATPTTPGDDDGQQPPAAVPGVYEADEEDRQRGRAQKPGN